MTARRIPATTITAIFVALVLGLIARSLIQGELAAAGHNPQFAQDIAYLIVPIVFAVLLFPLWRSERGFLAEQFQSTHLNWRLAGQAMAIGFLLRVVWWSQLIAGVSFGFYASADSNAIVGPTFSFQCQPPAVAALGFIVVAAIVPLMEEIVHRSYTITVLRRRGFWVSIIGSALIFALFHRVATIPFAFLAGVVFGVQYWLTRSLWASLLSHMTINGLIQIDWRCLSGHWNPVAADIPIVLPGIIASSMLFVCVILIYWLLQEMATGARYTPR